MCKNTSNYNMFELLFKTSLEEIYKENTWIASRLTPIIAIWSNYIYPSIYLSKVNSIIGLRNDLLQSETLRRKQILNKVFRMSRIDGCGDIIFLNMVWCDQTSFETDSTSSTALKIPSISHKEDTTSQWRREQHSFLQWKGELWNWMRARDVQRACPR